MILSRDSKIVKELNEKKIKIQATRVPMRMSVRLNSFFFILSYGLKVENVPRSIHDWTNIEQEKRRLVLNALTASSFDQKTDINESWPKLQLIRLI